MLEAKIYRRKDGRTVGRKEGWTGAIEIEIQTENRHRGDKDRHRGNKYID